MPIYRARVLYTVSLNKSRKTSVNIHRSSINNRPDIPDWSITPNLISRTGYSPAELDPPVNAIMNFQLVLEQGNPWAHLQRFYLLQEQEHSYINLEPSLVVYDQHYGMFTQHDFQGHVVKYFSAATSHDATVGFTALYGPGSIQQGRVEQVIGNLVKLEDNGVFKLEDDYAFLLEQ